MNNAQNLPDLSRKHEEHRFDGAVGTWTGATVSLESKDDAKPHQCHGFSSPCAHGAQGNSRDPTKSPTMTSCHESPPRPAADCSVSHSQSVERRMHTSDHLRNCQATCSRRITEHSGPNLPSASQQSPQLHSQFEIWDQICLNVYRVWSQSVTGPYTQTTGRRLECVAGSAPSSLLVPMQTASSP